MVRKTLWCWLPPVINKSPKLVCKVYCAQYHLLFCLFKRILFSLNFFITCFPLVWPLFLPPSNNKLRSIQTFITVDFFFLQHSFASTKYALTGSLLIWCSFGPSLTAWYHKQHYTITSSNAVQFSEKNNGNPAPLAITTTKCHNKIRTIFTVVYMCMRMMCLFGFVSACVLFCMTVVACCVNQIEYSEASIIATFNQMDQTNAITWNGMKIRSICSANLINIYVLANFYFSPWLWVAGEALYFVCCLCSSAVTNNGGGE